MTAVGNEQRSRSDVIRAVAPDDQDEFLRQFAGERLPGWTCGFDSSTLLADCGEYGEYALEPPPTGEDVGCDVLLVADAPVFIGCRPDPETDTWTIVYDILDD